MAVILSRDHALTVPLLSTHGTATLLSKDNHEVKVPLAPLLGASTLVRSIVAESRLNPGIHGPLVLSVAVAGDVLGSVADMLGVGESNVKEENIEKVKQVLDSLGVEANLSQIRKNIVYERTVTNEEDVELDRVRGLVSDEESDISEVDVTKAKDILVGVKSKPSQSRNNIEYENHADDIKLEIVFEPVSDEKSELSDCDEEYYTNREKIGERYDQCYRVNENVPDKTRINCNVCNYSTMSASHFKIHMSRHTGEKPYKCPICNYSCSSGSDLKKHSRAHTGEKPYKCAICNYSFSTSSDLKRPSRTHTGEKPYKCTICNFCCSQVHDLRKHKMTHTGEKPFKCKICDYSCSRAANLKEHQRIHTGEKPHSCKICNKTFSHLGQLNNHGKSHTGKKFTCKICNKSFSQPDYLRKHGRIHIGRKNHSVKK